MNSEQLIPTEQFCTHYSVTASFVTELNEIGLIETVTIDETNFIQIPQVTKIERMIRLHEDLNINIEGIHAIDVLLERIDSIQQEMLAIKNRLRLYEI
jgi:hypothetical protein